MSRPELGGAAALDGQGLAWAAAGSFLEVASRELAAGFAELALLERQAAEARTEGEALGAARQRVDRLGTIQAMAEARFERAEVELWAAAWGSRADYARDRYRGERERGRDHGMALELAEVAVRLPGSQRHLGLLWYGAMRALGLGQEEAIALIKSGVDERVMRLLAAAHDRQQRGKAGGAPAGGSER